MNDDDSATRGHRAFNEMREVGSAFDRVEAAIIKTLGETPVGADVKILRLHMTLQNLAAVRQAIQAVVDEGMIAEHAMGVAGLNRAA